jgi:hypothetical protein
MAVPFAVVAQVSSHSPQFVGSLAVSTQVPPQAFSAPEQELSQRPATHSSSSAHTLLSSQPPQ